MIPINSVTIAGNVVRDIQLRTTPTGKTVADFTVAINEKHGADKESVAFVGVTVWGKTAELCANSLRKGSGVMVSGKLTTETWDDKDGKRQSKTKVVAFTVAFDGAALPAQPRQSTENVGDDSDGEEIPF